MRSRASHDPEREMPRDFPRAVPECTKIPGGSNCSAGDSLL